MAMVAPDLALPPELLWLLVFLAGGVLGIALTPSVDRWRAFGLLLLCTGTTVPCVGRAIGHGLGAGDPLP